MHYNQKALRVQRYAFSVKRYAFSVKLIQSPDLFESAPASDPLSPALPAR